MIPTSICDCAFTIQNFGYAYFVLQIYHAKNFKMRHITYLYINFSQRYSLKCFKSLKNKFWEIRKIVRMSSNQFLSLCRCIIPWNYATYSFVKIHRMVALPDTIFSIAHLYGALFHGIMQQSLTVRTVFSFLIYLL